MRWFADGDRAAGLFGRIQPGPLGPDPEGAPEPADLSWFTGYDVVTGELSVFVQGWPATSSPLRARRGN
ncbi:MAG: hypothetical protein R3F43_29670 [bacterium]